MDPNVPIRLIFDEDGVEITDYRILVSSDDSEYIIDGESFTGDEIRGVILLSQKDNPFHILTFLRFWIIHILQLMFSFVGLIPIFIIERFKLNNLRNLGFIGMNMSFVVQSIIGTLILLSNIFWLRLLWDSMEDDEIKFSPLDLVFWFTVILVRAFVIATKYGSLSIEHYKIFESILMTDYLKFFDLMFATHSDGTLFNLYSRMLLVSQWKQINLHEF